MFKKLILVQGILLAFQTLLYFGSEFFQSKIHNVKRSVDDKIPFLPWTVLPYCFWFPMIAFYPLIVFRTDPCSYCGYLMTMVMEIVLSVVCYLIYPTSFQRPAPPDGFWGNFMKFVYHGSYRGLNCAPTEMTNYNVEEKDLQGETAITVEHVENNTSVRDMLGQRGIKPENLPASEDIKKLERRVKREEKKLAEQSGKLTNE